MWIKKGDYKKLAETSATVERLKEEKNDLSHDYMTLTARCCNLEREVGLLHEELASVSPQKTIDPEDIKLGDWVCCEHVSYSKLKSYPNDIFQVIDICVNPITEEIAFLCRQEKDKESVFIPASKVVSYFTQYK